MLVLPTSMARSIRSEFRLQRASAAAFYAPAGRPGRPAPALRPKHQLTGRKAGEFTRSDARAEGRRPRRHRQASPTAPSSPSRSSHGGAANPSRAASQPREPRKPAWPPDQQPAQSSAASASGRPRGRCHEALVGQRRGRIGQASSGRSCDIDADAGDQPGRSRRGHPAPSSRMPATLAPRSSTSFGHLTPRLDPAGRQRAPPPGQRQRHHQRQARRLRHAGGSGAGSARRGDCPAATASCGHAAPARASARPPRPTAPVGLASFGQIARDVVGAADAGVARRGGSRARSRAGHRARAAAAAAAATRSSGAGNGG